MSETAQSQGRTSRAPAKIQPAGLLRRVRLRYYKSIAACDVRLGDLTFLVGPNGSGKSNFLDSLRFVADALRYSLDHALRDRGGINEVRRRSGGHPTHIGIRLDFHLPGPALGHYSFHLGAGPGGSYVVRREECLLRGSGEVPGRASFRVEEGRVVSASFDKPPEALEDSLYLARLSGVKEFRTLNRSLSRMGFYNLNPDIMRDLQPPDPGDLLQRDGKNVSSVLGSLTSRAPRVKERIVEYLGKVVPGIEGVERKTVGPKETLEFRQEVEGSSHPWRFLASSMSDGTLRALGVLVALFQGAANGDPLRQVVGIEEPEVALHPAAAGVLTDALRDASERTQVLVTSHSTDLLDDESIPDDSLLAVVAERGTTRIGPLDETARSALRDHLYTAGELLRMDQLSPDPRETAIQPDQVDLFQE